MKRTWLLVLLTGLLFSGFSGLPGIFADAKGTEDAISAFELDKDHTTLGFKVKHLGISWVSGKFDTFTGKIMVKAGKLVAAEANIETASVDTDNAKRDEHLRSDEFLNTAKFAAITFKSKNVVHDGENVTITGDLTLCGQTREITLKGTFGGIVKVADWKMDKAGLELNGRINRQDFGLKFSKLLGTGELMVGDDVFLKIEIEGNRPAGG